MKVPNKAITIATNSCCGVVQHKSPLNHPDKILPHQPKNSPLSWLSRKCVSHILFLRVVCLLFYQNVFKFRCQMFRLCRIHSLECHTHVSVSPFAIHRAKQFRRFLWSTQRNLLNSFINFPRDWKINYRFCRECSGCRLLCLSFHSTRSTRRQSRIRHSNDLFHFSASPFTLLPFIARLRFIHKNLQCNGL